MAEARTLAEVEKEIAETKAALMDVHGTETEVYARIVGYYRAVKHWNKGKRNEFDLRKMFTLEDSDISAKLNEEKTEDSAYIQSSEALVSSEKETVSDAATTVTYEMFTKQTCPNCPPVKDFMSKLDMPGRAVDVDTEAGLAEAAKKGVFASPTVIFYNANGIETARCHNVDELEVVCDKVRVTA